MRIYHEYRLKPVSDGKISMGLIIARKSKICKKKMMYVFCIMNKVSRHLLEKVRLLLRYFQRIVRTVEDFLPFRVLFDGNLEIFLGQRIAYQYNYPLSIAHSLIVLVFSSKLLPISTIFFPSILYFVA